MKFLKRVAERLRFLREQQGKTQAEVAEAIGYTIANYQRYEYGTRVPAAEKLCLLADFFNVSVDYILGRTDKPRCE